MEPAFEISLNMRTCKGVETYGCFSLGLDQVFAHSLFQQLDGSDELSEDSVITIDLVKRENGLLFPLDMRHCSYNQLAENVKIITRELFKHLVLKNTC